MFPMSIKKRSLFSLVALAAALLAVGCSGGKPAQAPQAVAVKAIQVIQKDTTIAHEFVGQVQARNEVQIKAKVSGNIIAKMVTGGAAVTAGQPLFEIDSRQYETSLLSAKAQLAQSEAVLSNSRLETLRYKTLAAQQAIARQTLDVALSTEQQHEAVVDANRARLRQAQNDMQDTVIVSPIDGRMEVNELAVGNFVQAGQTVLATVSSVNPVLVQFSMSETEYLKFAQINRGAMPETWGKDLKLILSDGSQYPLSGHIEQIDKGLTQNTGALTLKAAFPNPQRLLLPGMFARVVAPGEVRKGAFLIPQRAVQELLGKTFVTVVAEGDKAETRAVKMGERIGRMWLVEEGLTAADRVVVEGTSKVQPGASLKVTMIGPDELDSPAAK